MSNYLGKLNNEQLEAVKQTEGPVLVLAGAGSGKTRVLTSRIAYILENNLCYPSQILAITFTNKAANEMRERVVNEIGEDANAMWISTIHSMCLRILRASISYIDGYNKNFTVYGEAETERLIKKIIQQNGLEQSATVKDAKYHISYAKTNDISPNRYMIEGKGANITTYSTIYKEYEMALQNSNALDFDDLILKTYHLLENHEEVLNYYANKFHYILIDEFQDTNELQYNIAKLLSSVHNNLFVVGDDDQSIYGWRGAEIKNILGFENDFPSAKVVKLQQNYRSTKRILELANAVIKHNNVRSKKQLWTNNEEGVKIEYYCGDEESFEARYTVNQIKALVDRGAKYSNFAILMRVNALSRTYEQELARNGIPFKVFGGFKFFERKEIKDLTAYLRIVVNPLDDDAFLRIINTPRRGIGEKTINELISYAKNKGKSLFDALCEVEEIGLSSPVTKKLLEFKKLLFTITLLNSTHQLTDVVDQIIELTNFLSQFEPETEENLARKMNIDEFKSSVKDYCRITKSPSLEDYLSSIALYSDIDEADSSDYVTIATIHAVKGLEFDTVFIAGCDETIFPISRAVGSPSDMEEERRLMYVAITRAEKRLYITRANSRYLYGNRNYTTKSRFLTEVADILDIDKDSRMRESVKTAQQPTYKERNEYLKSKEFEFGYSSDVPTESMTIYKKTFNRDIPKVQNTSVQSNSYEIGRKVSHKRFGIGTIVGVRNTGCNLIIDVMFGNEKKSLATKFAPIELL